MSLEELQTSANSQNGNTDNSEKYAAKCFVQTSGTVNCSDVIYDDEKSWRKSRHQIDILIHVLKNKILELKDIRKHLNDHKPVTIKDNDDVMGLFSEEVSTENLTKIPKHATMNSNSTRRTNKHHHHHNHHIHHQNVSSVLNARTKIHSDEISSISTISFSTITMNPATITTLRSVMLNSRTNPKNNTTGPRGSGNSRRPHKENSSKNGTIHENDHRKNATRHTKHPAPVNRDNLRTSTMVAPSKRTTAPTYATTSSTSTTTSTTTTTLSASTTVSPFEKEDEVFILREDETSENILGSSTTLNLDVISPSTQSSDSSIASYDISRKINLIDDKLTNTNDYNDTISTVKPHRHIYGELDEQHKQEHTECFCEPDAER